MLLFSSSLQGEASQSALLVLKIVRLSSRPLKGRPALGPELTSQRDIEKAIKNHNIYIDI